MSSNPLVPSFRLPSKIPSGVVHPTVKKAIENNVNGLVDVNQAIASLKAQVDAAKTTAAATTSTNTVITVQSTQFPGIGTVNDESGQTIYATMSSDNGALIVLDDASSVAVTLNSAVQVPFFCFITNLGAGLATLTPSAGGTINGGATFTLPLNYTAICVLQNNTPGAWWATALPKVPVTFNAVTHEFLISYNAVTGLFTAAQPAFTDISGIATTIQIGTGTPAAGKYVDGAAGAWTALPTPTVLPNFADNETPTPVPDGVNTIFTLAHSPSPITSSQGFMNGLLQDYGVDYTILGPTITFTVAPPATPSPATLVWFYRY